MRKSAAIIVSILIASTSLASESVTIDGVIYEDVRWGEVRPPNVTLFHRSGVTSIPLSKLPEDVREKLSVDPAQLATNAQPKKQPQTTAAANSMDRETTARELDAAIAFAQVSKNLGYNIGCVQRVSCYEKVLRAQRELARLQKHGHRDYQASIREFLGACGKAIELRKKLQEERPEFKGAKAEYEAEVRVFKKSPSSVAGTLRLQQLSRQKDEAEAFYKVVGQLREDANKFYERGLDLKTEADAR